MRPGDGDQLRLPLSQVRFPQERVAVDDAPFARRLSAADIEMQVRPAAAAAFFAQECRWHRPFSRAGRASHSWQSCADGYSDRTSRDRRADKPRHTAARRACRRSRAAFRCRQRRRGHPSRRRHRRALRRRPYRGRSDNRCRPSSPASRRHRHSSAHSTSACWSRTTPAAPGT